MCVCVCVRAPLARQSEWQWVRNGKKCDEQEATTDCQFSNDMSCFFFFWEKTRVYNNVLTLLSIHVLCRLPPVVPESVDAGLIVILSVYSTIISPPFLLLISRVVSYSSIAISPRAVVVVLCSMERERGAAAAAAPSPFPSSFHTLAHQI